MISLVIFTKRQDIMGKFTNSRLTNLLAITGTTVILLLNALLLIQAFGVAIPAFTSLI
jgi:manganese transport protein